MTKRMKKWAIQGFAVLAASSVWAVATDHYAEGVVDVANNSGYGKVYVAHVAQDEAAPTAPTTDAYVNTTMASKSANVENATYDFYFHVQEQPGCTFLGWSASADATTPELGSDNPYKMSIAASADGTETKRVYALFSAPETRTATFAGTSSSWFNPANWDVNATPESPIYLPVIPAGKSVVYDPVGGGGTFNALNFTEVRLGGGAAGAPAELELKDGGMAVKKFVVGAAAGGGARVTQDGGSLVFYGEDEFILGDVAGSADWNEYVLNEGAVTGPGAAKGLVVGHAGKGRLTVNGGTFTQTGPVVVAREEGSAGEIVVTGGSLTVANKLQLGANGSARVEGEGLLVVDDVAGAGTLTLNGGTLKYRVAGIENETKDPFVAELSGFYLGAKGGVIDTSGAEVKIARPLVKDPSLGMAGCGTFVKRGAGKLWMAKGSALKGDVVVEEGLLVVDPGDVDLGRVLVAEGAELAFGTQTGTLVFDTTAGDIDCSNYEVLGANKLVKEGAGTLQLNMLTAQELEINEGTVDIGAGYRYYRVSCEGLVTWCGYSGGWAMAEMAFWSGDQKLEVDMRNVSWDTVSLVEGQTHRAGCTPEYLFDGNYETYMFDLRLSSQGSNFNANYKDVSAAWFAVDFGRRVLVTACTWYRSPTSAFYSTVDGDMYDANDPGRLTIYGSNDGVKWINLAYGDGFDREEASVPSGRSTNASPRIGGTIPVLAAELSSTGCDKLTMKEDTRLLVLGTDLHAGEVVSAGDAKIVLEEGALILDRQSPGVLSGAFDSSLRVIAGTTVETRDAPTFGPDARIQVDGGATLAIAPGSGQAIPTLVYDWTQGGGAIKGFRPARNGELALVNVPAEARLCTVLPYELTDIADATNLNAWKLTVDGAVSGLRVMIKNGRLAIVESGLALLFR